jgi:hypothetical protein
MYTWEECAGNQQNHILIIYKLNLRITKIFNKRVDITTNNLVMSTLKFNLFLIFLNNYYYKCYFK